MNVADQINSVIDKLADKLGVAASAVYPMLLKQAYVNGIIDIVTCIGAILFTIGFCIYLKKIYIDKDSDGDSIFDIAYRDDSEILHIFLTVGLVIGEIVFVIAFMCSLGDAITAFVNPQYYVLKQILDLLKSSK